jgi:hypothetical protein
VIRPDRRNAVHRATKIADLIYVPHGTYIAAKMRARDAATSGTAP